MQAVRTGTIETVGTIGTPFEDPNEREVEPETPDYPLALVEWHDAWFDLDLEGPEDRRPDYLVRTVGFLVREGPRFVSLAQEILPDGEGLRAVTHIPLPIVERVIPLHPPAATLDRVGPPAPTSR